MMKKAKKELTPAQIASLKRASEGRHRARLEREARGIYKATFMRLSLTDDAYAITKDMTGAEFREFASAAILNAAKGNGMLIP